MGWMEQIGRTLVILGGLTALVGGLAWALGRFLPGLRLGRLPGDFAFESGGTKVFVPIMTMLLLSALVSIAMWLIGVLKR